MRNILMLTVTINGAANVSAWANSDGIHALLTMGDTIEGTTSLRLDDAAARALLVHLTAAVAARGQS